MRIEVTQDHVNLGVAAARFISEQIQKKPSCVLALPTGETSRLMYEAFAAIVKKDLIDVRKATILMLDEYVGISGEDHRSYRSYLRKHLLLPAGISSSQTLLLNGETDNTDLECKRYEEAIQSFGGLDLAVLGIGRNGHIAFNEPGSPWESSTRVVRLAQQTRQQNRVPQIEKALSVGIRTIMRSRHVLLLAAGDSKSGILAAALAGPITTDVPASILQLHPNLTIIADVKAAEQIQQAPERPNVSRVSH